MRRWNGAVGRGRLADRLGETDPVRPGRLLGHAAGDEVDLAKRSLAVPPGENRWLLTLNRLIAAKPAGLP